MARTKKLGEPEIHVDEDGTGAVIKLHFVATERRAIVRVDFLRDGIRVRTSLNGWQIVPKDAKTLELRTWLR